MTATALTALNSEKLKQYCSFSGNDLGEKSNYDYVFRDYSPISMRFTTVDPVKDSFNWYAYVGNDPINFIDPFGLCSESDQKTETWIATSLEASISVAALGPEGVALAFGSTLVNFRNLETGENITSGYNFVLTEAEGVVLSAGASLQIGVVSAEFEAGTDPESVAKSYSGPFVTQTLQLGPIAGSTITSSVWNGVSGGASAGLGAGFTSFTINYSVPLW